MKLQSTTVTPLAEDVIKNLFSTSGKCGIIFVSLASKKEKSEIGGENGRKNVKNTARKCRKNVGISLEKAWNFVRGTLCCRFYRLASHCLQAQYSVLQSYEDSADRADDVPFLI